MGTSHELPLDHGPQVVPVARQFARRVLGDEAISSDDVELVVTELVTNAVLHGAGPLVIRLHTSPDRVRVEVQDGGRDLPVIPRHNPEAMTGRGLALVAALVHRWGVEPAAAGKVVWAEMVPDEGGGVPAQSRTEGDIDVDALLAAFPDDDDAEPSYTVRLGAVPTVLLLAAKSDLDNVVRELTLAQAEAEARGEELPAALAELMQAVTGEWASARTSIKQQAIAAAERGDVVTDLVLSQPLSAADAGERYLRALDEADRYSRAARMLSLEPTPVHRVFRRWYVQSLVDQLRAQARGVEVPPVRSFLEVLASQVDELASLRGTAERLALLQTVTSQLAAAQTVPEMTRIVLDQAGGYLGALSGRAYLVDGDVLASVSWVGGTKDWIDRYDTVPLDADLPGPQVMRTGEPLLVHGLAEIERLWPALTGVYAEDRSLNVVPLIVGDHRIGLLTFTYPPIGMHDEAERAAFVTAVADVYGQGLERALALRAADDARLRLEFLADASVALSASLDYQATLRAVTELMVPRLADWCVVQTLDGDRLQTAALLHFDPDRVAWAKSMEGRYPTQMDAPTGAPNVLRTGLSELYPEISPEMVEAAATDAEHLELIRNLGMSSAMVVPLTGRSGTFGAVTLIYAESGRRYDPADVSFAEDVARRAALALETATTFREQSGRLADVTRVAEAAQRAILAPPPERVGSVALRARYVSAAAEALIGGDLYEVVSRPGAVRLLIGDVRGKGLMAVRTATVVLGEFRASAADQADLGRVARQIDRRLRPYLGEEDFVTALIAEINDDGHFAVASCGHPPALLASRGVITEVTSDHSTPLGLGAAPELATGQLEAGDRLLLYTDGAIEARDKAGHFVDLTGLAQAMLDRPLDSVLDEVLDGLRSQVGAELGDDLALLIAEYLGPTDS